MKLYVAEFTIRAPFVAPDDASAEALVSHARIAIDGEIREQDSIHDRDPTAHPMCSYEEHEMSGCLPWDSDCINKPERSVGRIWQQEQS